MLGKLALAFLKVAFCLPSAYHCPFWLLVFVRGGVLLATCRDWSIGERGQHPAERMLGFALLGSKRGSG